MCQDSPIRQLEEYKSITVLTRCCGPTVIMAPTYQALIKEVHLFLDNSLDVRTQEAPTAIKANNTFKREGASIGIIRQVSERG
jgi:hypothetical protein